MFHVISFKNPMLHLIRNRVVPTTLASVFQNTATITDNVDKLCLNDLCTVCQCLNSEKCD